MQKNRLGVSVKFVSTIAIIYSILIIILSFSFHYILKTNSNVLRDILVSNNENLISYKAKMIIDRLKDDDIINTKTLSKSLYRYCKDDDDFLYIMVFSKTFDDNYFKIRRKIPLNPLLKIKVKKNRNVKEEKALNYLRQGMLRETVDPKIYSSNGLYWQSIYHPFKIKNRTYVIEFFVSSSKVYTALSEYSEVIKKTKRYIIFITGAVIIAVIIITLMFIQNFSHIIKKLSQYMKHAADGNLDVSLNPTNDNDLNELALSFNSIVSELKGLKEKDNIIKELENKETLSDIFKYGVSVLKEKRFDDAICIFRTLTMLKPDGFGSYFNLGVALAKIDDYGSSLEMFGKALESNPNHELTLNYIQKVSRLQELNEKAS